MNPMQPNQMQGSGQERPLTDEEKKKLEEAQAAIQAICKEYGIELVPRLVLEPAGVVFAMIGAKFVGPTQPSRIIVPKTKVPQGFNPKG